jgi:DNA primase small subunit
MEINDEDIEMLPEFKELVEEPISIITKENMQIYYKNFFPYHSFFLWLGKDNSEYFERREFSFTMPDERYFRFQCFKNETELKNQIIKLQPKKIDIGAVYNTLPKNHEQTNSFNPIEKEIVFDIDMTDYDNIRTCCKDAKLCNKCWKFMEVAYEILDKILREDFGFKNLLYCFSGRRGIHCWLCDNNARRLKNNGRIAIAKYIQFQIQNTKNKIVQGLNNKIHPSINRAISIIDKYFENDILIGQDILNFDGGKNLLKGLIKAYYLKEDNSVLDDVEKELNMKNSSVQKFKNIEEILQRNKNFNRGELCIKDFKLNVLYPRLDINVSKHINHLLKSPFCIHPKTGLVSVPLDDYDIKNFKIEDIPRLDFLVNDYKEGKTNQNFEKYIQLFEKFAKDCNENNKS